MKKNNLKHEVASIETIAGRPVFVTFTKVKRPENGLWPEGTRMVCSNSLMPAKKKKK